MTKELSQVLAADSVRRLSREQNLLLQPRLLRMRWRLVWKCTQGGRSQEARLVVQGYQDPAPTHEFTDSGSDDWENVSSFAPPVMFLNTIVDGSSVTFHQISCKCQDEKSINIFQSKFQLKLVICFPDTEGNPARHVSLMKSSCGFTSAPRAWWLDITKNSHNWVGKPCR